MEEVTHVAAREAFGEILTREGVTVECRFIPFSASKNAGGDKPWRSINWRCTVKKGDRVILAGSEYGQGIGHLPGYQHAQRLTVDEDAAISNAIERGDRYNGRKIKPPTAVDVLSSLVQDGGAIDCPTFEEWASEYDYDADSRKAEAIYRKCVETGLALRAELGEAVFSELRELAHQL